MLTRIWKLMLGLSMAIGLSALGQGSSSAASVGHHGDSFWSGYVDYGNNTYSKSVAHWTLPGVSSPGEVSVWVGLGGAALSAQGFGGHSTNGGLIQIGTDVTYGSPPSAWYAGPSGLSQTMLSCTQTLTQLQQSGSPAPQIAASVAWLGNGTAQFSMNINGNICANFPLPNLKPDLSTSEFIVERTRFCSTTGTNCRVGPVPDFGTISFTNARSYIGNTPYAFTSLPYIGLTLDSDGQFYPPANNDPRMLAYPTNALGENFVVIWTHRSAPGDVNGDDVVNCTDYAQLRAEYGQTGVNLPADLNNDGVVNIQDLSILAAYLNVSSC